MISAPVIVVEADNLSKENTRKGTCTPSILSKKSCILVYR